MNHKMRVLAGVLVVGLLTMALSGCAQATAVPTATPAPPAVLVTVAKNPILGDVLVDGAGMTLYLYTKDSPNVSNCSGTCAQNWPPYLVPSGGIVKGSSTISASLSTIQRTDGTVQVAVNGMPVYYFIKDKVAGDVFGQGVGGIWFVLDTGGNKVTTALPTAAPKP